MDIINAYSETQLVTLIKQNNRSAFDHLFHNYGGALSYIISKVIADSHTAEDILQETFVSVWNNIDKYDSTKGTLYTWMRNIARNKAIDCSRCWAQTLRTKSTGLEECTQSHEINNDKIGMKQLIFRMQPKYATIIHLKYYEGSTFEEIASELNIPLGTIKTRMRMALRMLRMQFNEAAVA